MNPFLFAVALLVVLAGCRPAAPGARVDDATLRAADADSANWLMHGRTYDEHRFSPLAQINAQSVSRLGLVWSRELETTRGVEATPLVADGVLYTTGPWSVVYALDAATGAQRWTYDPHVAKRRGAFACCDVVNRGLALYRGKLYLGALDGRLVALDARSGSPVWTAATVDTALPYTITGAPRIAKGLVLIGNGGAEYDVRGFVSATRPTASSRRLSRARPPPGAAATGRAAAAAMCGTRSSTIQY